MTAFIKSMCPNGIEGISMILDIWVNRGCDFLLLEHSNPEWTARISCLFFLESSDSSKQLSALLSVESSAYRTLAWRSPGENASPFPALPLYSCYDAPSPLTDVRSPCQFNCILLTVIHQDSLHLVSSLFIHIQ